MDLRLQRVAEYVTGKVVCDIGCDHGKLCAYLLESGKAEVVYGVDVSEQSLEKSRLLKEKNGLENFQLVVGNGFEPVLDKNIDTGVICGIGSNETMGIIKRQMDFAKSLKRLILCPQKNTFTVREFLFNNGFAIDDEDMVFENGRYYNIFVCSKRENYSIGETDDVDIFVGRALIQKQHPLLKQWLDKRISDMQSNIDNYTEGVKTGCEEKLINMQRMYRAYERGRELCR